MLVVTIVGWRDILPSSSYRLGLAVIEADFVHDGSRWRRRHPCNAEALWLAQYRVSAENPPSNGLMRSEFARIVDSRDDQDGPRVH